MNMSFSYRQRGIALVLVLWVIVLLTVIAGAMAVSQRAGVSMVSNARLSASMWPNQVGRRCIKLL